MWVDHFPLTEQRFMAAERAQVNVNKTIEKIAAHDTQKIANKERNELQEIEERRLQLLEEVKDPTLKPLDDYITQKVSRANCLWMYVRCMTKVNELRGKYTEFNERIAKLDKEHPAFKDEYKEQYLNTLAERNIVPDYENIVQFFDDENCMKAGIKELTKDDDGTMDVSINQISTTRIPKKEDKCCDDKCCDDKCCDDKCCDDKCCDDKGEGEGEGEK